jgi:hypothetical protein
MAEPRAGQGGQNSLAEADWRLGLVRVPKFFFGSSCCRDVVRRPAQVVRAIRVSFGRGRKRHMAVAAGVTIDARAAPLMMWEW